MPTLPDCGVVDAGVEPEEVVFDPACQPLRADERPRDGAIFLTRPAGLHVENGVAHVDFLSREGLVYLRLRIGLDDGVVAMTDSGPLTPERTWGEMCAITPDGAYEVRALSRDLAEDGPWGFPSGPIVRVLRRSDGAEVLSFGEVLPLASNDWRFTWLWLTPEFATNPACCPATACTIRPCGVFERPPDGCRWLEVTSPHDGLCHAVSVY